MICIDLWQFVSTEDLANSSDTHPAGLAFAELYPYLLNQPAWRDSPLCQVLSWPDISSTKLCTYIHDNSSMAMHCVTLWHIWQSSTRRVQSWWNSSKGTWQWYFVLQDEQKKKRKKSKQVDETSGILRWKKRWGHCWMTITDLGWGYWSVTTLKSYRYSVFSSQSAKTLLTHSA